MVETGRGRNRENGGRGNKEGGGPLKPSIGVGRGKRKSVKCK